MNDTFGRLLVSAKMLYANAEGCAVNHHGEDFALHGLPGWLADCRADIAAAEAAHARAQAEPVAAGAWTREDLAAGLAELDGIDLVPPLKSVVDLEYLNRADDLLTFLSVASAANEPLGAIHPAPAQEPALEPSPSQWNAGAEAMREACAAAIGPVGERPCDCERCDCRNRDDAERVARWDEAKACAEVIRALPLPTPPAGEG